MRDFTGMQELHLTEASCIARAMWRVAEVEEGVHEKEREMIEEFYSASCTDEGADPESFKKQPWDAAEAREILKTDELKELLISSCYLLGYADGRCSQVEKNEIAIIAADIGVSPEKLEQLEREVKRVLLSPFEEIRVFRDATYDIASKQLGLSAKEVDELLADGEK